ncbi:MAG: homocysteine S-methyltransferase family protein [Clostridia bacterium]|nr:homocysteine S-methyltransferase family protein [Clostridia bacterium]
MKILDYIKDNILYLDGGMGTLLQKEGLMPGELPERWNISHPDVIKKIHKDYFEAGSNVVNTNTFGANSLKFSDDELEEIIASAIKIANEARDEAKGDHEKYVALDIGPLGKLLKPYGDLEFSEAVSIFSKTVALGEKYGADLIMIETMNDSYETKAAVLAAKENSNLPVFCSNAYGEDGLLMTGASPEAMSSMLEGMRVSAFGMNCSLGPEALKPIYEKMLEVASTPIILKPNAGLPRSVDGKTCYDVTPAEFAEEMKKAVEKGVRIVGGCCGTTPEYIRALKEATKDILPKPIEDKNLTVVSSYTHAVYFGNEPVLIGERINPTGKKRLKQALCENDMDYILKEALSQEEAGAKILDVNTGLPEIDEGAMLTSVVCAIQAVTNLPLQIDTSDADAMEKALRLYNGKAMINSVNGKEECMEKIFPLAKKYGGLLVALTLDEKGIPETAEGRVAIAERIIKKAKEYGIDKKDIIFDTLAMTVSADSSAAKETLKALNIIREKLGCHTSLGVSNVSFGLPERDGINATFFAMALSKGLSAAIMNPFSIPMMRTYRAYMALSDMDENCTEYISFAENHKMEETAGKADNAKLKGASALSDAIIKGLTESATSLTKELLKTKAPLSVVEEEIIPALDIVGKGFEEKKVYLPGLLMSAEAAKCAFSEVKEAMESQKSDMNKKCPVIIATVKGDIHDIGKNIVKLLLENYGFDVTDLGKDVEPSEIVRAAKEKNAPLVGLSALMTTTVPYMEETIKLIRRELPSCRVMVGGAVLTEDYAKAIGADKYAKDAMEAVRYAEEIYK